MKLNFNFYKKLDSLDLFLKNPDDRDLFAIPATNRHLNIRFNDISELTFAVYKFQTKTDNTTLETPGYDYLETNRIVSCTGVGDFRITNVNTQDDGILEHKEITCESYQSIFKNFGIQTEERLYCFYNENDPEDENYDFSAEDEVPSVVGQLHKQVGIDIDLTQGRSNPVSPYDNWTITYINPGLKFDGTASSSALRSFEEEAVTAYDWMVNKIEEAFECVIIFDFEYRTIQALYPGEVTSLSNVVFSFSNMMKELTVTEDSDELVTVMDCSGDSCNIQQANPTGTNYICDFSYYMDKVNYRWMSADLITKLEAWEADVAEKTPVYEHNILTRNEKEDEKLTIQADLSMVSTRLQDLKSALDNKSSVYPLLKEMSDDGVIGNVRILPTIDGSVIPRKLYGSALQEKGWTATEYGTDESKRYAVFANCGFYDENTNTKHPYIFQCNNGESGTFYVIIHYTPIPASGPVYKPTSDNPNELTIKKYLDGLCTIDKDIIANDAAPWTSGEPRTGLKLVLRTFSKFGTIDQNDIAYYIEHGSTSNPDLQSILDAETAWDDQLNELTDKYYSGEYGSMYGIIAPERVDAERVNGSGITITGTRSIYDYSSYKDTQFTEDTVITAHTDPPKYTSTQSAGGSWSFDDAGVSAKAYEHVAANRLYFIDDSQNKSYCKLEGVAKGVSQTSTLVPSGFYVYNKQSESYATNISQINQLCDQFNANCNGNVDYHKRPFVSPIKMAEYFPEWEELITVSANQVDTNVATTYSIGIEIEDYYNTTWSLDMTPIRENGEILTESELNLYADTLSGFKTLTALIQKDAARYKLIINAKEGSFDDNEEYWSTYYSQMGTIKDSHWTLAKPCVIVNYTASAAEAALTGCSGFVRFCDFDLIVPWIDREQGLVDEYNASIATIQEAIDTIDATLKAIASELNIISFMSDTPTLLRELKRYWIEGSYHNDNIKLLEDMTPIESMELSNQLLEAAKVELNKVAQPRYSFSINTANVVNVPEFQEQINELVLGKTVAVERADGVWYYPALLGLDIGFDGDDEMTLSFANALKLNDWGYTMADLMSSSSATSKQVQSNWQNLTSYSKDSEEISALISDPLNATLRAGIANAKNQEFNVDDTGILGRKTNTAEGAQEKAFDNEQIRLTNNLILFTDDGWNTAKSALGKVYYLDDNGMWQTAYGLVAEAIIGNLLIGQTLKITNPEGTVTIDKDGITILNQAGTQVFHADQEGNVDIYNYVDVDTYAQLVLTVDGLVTTVSRKNTVYRQNTRPVSTLTVTIVSGDMWFVNSPTDVTDATGTYKKYKWYRYNGSTWDIVTDGDITGLQTTTSQISQRCDTIELNVSRKISTYKQKDAPTDTPAGTLSSGDLWYCDDDDQLIGGSTPPLNTSLIWYCGSSSDGYTAYTWYEYSESDSEWVTRAAPTYMDGQLYRYNGSSWVVLTDSIVESQESALVQQATEIAARVTKTYTATGASGMSWSLTDTAWSVNSINNGTSTNVLYVNSNGMVVDGTIKARSGFIGTDATGFSINGSYISKNKTSYDDAYDGVYIGTNGIGLGKSLVNSGHSAFYVTDVGAMHAESGTIAAYTISGSSLYSNGHTAADDGHEGLLLSATGIDYLGSGTGYRASDTSGYAASISSSGVVISKSGQGNQSTNYFRTNMSSNAAFTVRTTSGALTLQGADGVIINGSLNVATNVGSSVPATGSKGDVFFLVPGWT